MRNALRIMIFAIVALGLAAGGMVLRGSESESVSLWISPEGVLSGKTLEAGEEFDMTLHLQGEPATAYALQVSYEGDVGPCEEGDSATLTTNPQGKAVFTCTFTPATAPATGSVLFSVLSDETEVGAATALFNVVAAEEDEEQEETDEQDAERADNHGGCVSYWAHRSKADGLVKRWRGEFISWIAQQKDCTTSTREDAKYVDHFNEVLSQQQEALAAEGASVKGKPAKAEKRPRK